MGTVYIDHIKKFKVEGPEVEVILKMELPTTLPLEMEFDKSVEGNKVTLKVRVVEG